MRTPRVKKVGTDDEMGLGWHLRRIGGVATASHGGTLGHISLLELVPERRMAFAILTNHSNGWRLIQDVERTALATLEGLKLDPAHTIGHRGLNETMPDAPILSTQPDPAPYVGVYRRPPLNATNTLRVENGQLMLDGNSIAFDAPDRAGSRRATRAAIRSSSSAQPMELSAGCAWSDGSRGRSEQQALWYRAQVPAVPCKRIIGWRSRAGGFGHGIAPRG